ncbi:MAG: aminotransferase class I/II-fold pyridoxal phosphate-dependent enzyme [Bacteroidetes bacterium]|nr:aminotransferase class I/II-fold pyridoxal phosphate-dependent enzyme [Bacteroidota bacterium]
MTIPTFDLLHWITENAAKAEFDFASSNIQGIGFAELARMAGYKIPGNFDLGKNTPAGRPALREALAEMYSCGDNNIVTAAGGTEANFLVFYALLQPGDEVIVEQPGYCPLWYVPQSLGARIIHLPRRPENAFQPDPNELKMRITPKTRLIVLTNLHNPSGVLIPKERIATINSIAKKAGCYVLVDEIFLHAVRAAGRSSAGMENVIITSSLTKIFGLGGLRTGWIIASKELSQIFQQAKEMIAGAGCHLSEAISAYALSASQQALTERFLKVARTNFPIVQKWMRDNNDILEWIPPVAGILCFPKYRSETDSLSVARYLLNDFGVLVSPGCLFGLEQHFRLNFRSDTISLEKGLKRMEKGLRAL